MNAGTADGREPPAWRAGVFLYSGRRDPSWDVSPSVAAACVEMFEHLDRTGATVPAQVRLGYRGAWLLAPDGRRWDAFEGVAWSGHDRRLDTTRAVERTLLESAPEGSLPAGWRLWLGPFGSE